MSATHQSVFAPVSISATAVFLVVALVYLRGWIRLRSSAADAAPGWKLGSFLGGVVLLWAAVGSPLAGLDHQLLSMHMLQHLLLMTVAPPLLLLGDPGFVFQLGAPAAVSGMRVPQHPVWIPARRIGEILTRPRVALLIATAVLIGWHFPAAFQIAMESERWHAIEGVSFLGGGLLFWWPVMQPWRFPGRSPQWWIPLYLFLATLPCDALSAFLAFCGRVIYPHYLHARGPFNISALQDQEAAGALMWVVVTFAYLIPAVVVTVRILSPAGQHLQQPQLDLSQVDRPLHPSSAEVA